MMVAVPVPGQTTEIVMSAMAKLTSAAWRGCLPASDGAGLRSCCTSRTPVDRRPPPEVHPVKFGASLVGGHRMFVHFGHSRVHSELIGTQSRRTHGGGSVCTSSPTRSTPCTGRRAANGTSTHSIVWKRCRQSIRLSIRERSLPVINRHGHHCAVTGAMMIDGERLSSEKRTAATWRCRRRPQ
jgi:hypothetical protein